MKALLSVLLVALSTVTSFALTEKEVEAKIQGVWTRKVPEGTALKFYAGKYVSHSVQDGKGEIQMAYTGDWAAVGDKGEGLEDFEAASGKWKSKAGKHFQFTVEFPDDKTMKLTPLGGEVQVWTRPAKSSL